MFTKLVFASDLPTWALFVEMAIAAVVVIMAGTRFTRLADTVADRLNLSAGWVGLVLLATVTSLPELVTGATATWIDNVDLALGNIFGSCSFNITLIVLLNALIGGGSVLRGVGSTHALTSSFGLLLMAEALLGLVFFQKFTPTPAGEIAWALLIFVTYAICMKLTYSHEKATAGLVGDAPERQRVGNGIWSRLALTVMILVAASWWLARIGDVLSTHEIKMIGRPLGATFVGACFLALATSLPEIVTSITAVRLGKLDLALGNIFGSNMFNVFVIPLLKIVSLAGGQPLLLKSQPLDGMDNLIAGLLAVVLTAITIGALAYKSQRKLPRRFGYDSILIGVTYVAGMTLLVMKAG
ncbi:MAG: hypothetical protein IH989_00465 [Planctomycetes bacterium]|nr:hypothetical protein [Planctomycetota bacterium]